MTTHNFHFYIGSEAKIHFCTLKDGAVIVPCKNVTINLDGGIDYLDDLRINVKSISHRAVKEGFVRLLLRPLSSMTQEEHTDLYSVYSPVHNSMIEDSWWEELVNRFRNVSPEILWCIKKGFDVGIIPEGYFIIDNGQYL